MTLSEKKVVVVVGGGYAGAFVAKQLSKSKGAKVILIDKGDSFCHNIGAPRALIDKAFLEEKLEIPFDLILQKHQNIEFVKGEVAQVTEQVVTLSDEREIPFDFAVLATGSEYFFKDKAKLLESSDAVEKAEHVLIVGGGPAGVECAGEIANKYGKTKTVTLVHSHDHLLGIPENGLPLKLHKKLMQKLTDAGVKIILGHRVNQQDDSTFVAVKGDEAVDLGSIDFHLFCTGEKISTHLIYSETFGDVQNKRGQLKSDKFSRVEGRKHIFVVGDLSDNGVPNMAYFARKNAEGVTVPNVLKAIEGKDPSKSTPSPAKVMVVNLGPTDGAAYLPPGMLVGGTITAFLKSKDMMYSSYFSDLTK